MTTQTATFQTDGCTLFPDGWLGLEWGVCCDRHDWDFWVGDGVVDFLTANYDLWSCVATRSDIFVATLVLIGVSTGGLLFYIFGTKRGR